MISKNQILNLHSQGLLNQEIAEALKCSTKTISSCLVTNSLKANRKNDGYKLTIHQKEVLVGTLMGDSSLGLTHPNGSPSLKFAHTIKNTIYFNKKVSVFSNIPHNIWTYTNISGVQPKIGQTITNNFATLNCKMFKEWQNAFYGGYKGKKIINKEYVEKWFSYVSLAYLIMDDGCKTPDGLNLNLQSFTLEDLTWFKEFLQRRFNLLWHLRADRGKYYFLGLSEKSSSQLLYLVESEITSDMQYKLDGCRNKRNKVLKKLKALYEKEYVK